MEAVSQTNKCHLGAWEHPSADDLDGDSAAAERRGRLSGYRVVGASMESCGGPHGQAIPRNRTPRLSPWLLSQSRHGNSNNRGETGTTACLS